MYLLTAVSALVPLEVVTVTSTVPAGSPGVWTLITLSPTWLMYGAGVAPNVTAVTPQVQSPFWNPLPEMVANWTAPAMPVPGLTKLITGADDVTKVKWSGAPWALVPPGVTTVTSAVVAAIPGGLCAIRCLSS